MPRIVFYGLAIGSVGGPLGLVALYVPQAVADARASAALVVVLGTAIFALPVIVWRRYAATVAGAGGLYSFVEAAAGVWPARLEGAIWAFSYFLYMPYTVAFVVYDVLGVAFPGISRARPWLEVGIPLVMVAGLVARRMGVFVVTAVLAAAQVALVAVFAGVEIAHTGIPSSTIGLNVGAGEATKAALAVSLFFICASLPLFLGAEVSDASRVTRRGLTLSLLVGGVCILAGAASLVRVPKPLIDGPLPGWEIAYNYGGRWLADSVVVGIAVSLLTLVMLEYVALARLLHSMLRVGLRKTELWTGVAFVATAVVSLSGPQRFYDRLSPPSLVALFASQVIVFAVYPLFRRRARTLTPTDVLLAVGAGGMMVYGLYTALSAGGGS